MHGYTILGTRILEFGTRLFVSGTQLLESGTQFLKSGALETCIYILVSCCICVCCFHDMYCSFYAKRISCMI